MWENNRWIRLRRIILNVILVLLIAAILTGLLYVMLRVRHQTEVYDEQLSELYVQQQQQQTEARQESVDNIQIEYEKDMDTVAQYLPGIVCWGDILTQGSSGNISYPSVLKTYLDTYFCDIYDFRSTIPNAEEFARLKWDDFKVSVPVVNMGGGPENSLTVLGRSGAVPYVLKYDVLIPASAEPVEVSITSLNGQKVTPLMGSTAGINNVTLDGVEGTLSVEADTNVGFYSYNAANVYKYYFTRLEEGEEVYVNAGTALLTAAADEYRDYIHVVWLGSFGSFNTAGELVSQVKDLLSRQTNNPERYIVLGICGISGTQYNAARMDDIDTAMMQAFGNRYINVRKYLMEDGLSDANITPTKKDTSNIKNKKIPDSFSATTNSAELNGKAYTLIGKLVYDRMESLGYFDEVFEELGIRETMKQILKEDPGYFDRIITNSLK